MKKTLKQYVNGDVSLTFDSNASTPFSVSHTVAGKDFSLHFYQPGYAIKHFLKWTGNKATPLQINKTMDRLFLQDDE